MMSSVTTPNRVVELFISALNVATLVLQHCYTMQNPQRDLPVVLTGLATSRSPADLRTAVQKFYTHDASLHHPLGIVEHGPNSRQKILGVYEWHRIISPDTTSSVNAVC
jgi:hypothetical protein